MVRTKQSEILKRSGRVKTIKKRLSKGMANQGPHGTAAAQARARRLSKGIRELGSQEIVEVDESGACDARWLLFSLTCVFGVGGEGGATQRAVEQDSSSGDDESDQEIEVRGTPHVTCLTFVA